MIGSIAPEGGKPRAAAKSDPVRKGRLHELAARVACSMPGYFTSFQLRVDSAIPLRTIRRLYDVLIGLTPLMIGC